MLDYVELTRVGACIFEGETHAYVISSLETGPSPLKLKADTVNLYK